MQPLVMKLNGQDVTLQIDPSTMLVDVLRDGLHLTGTKVGCNEGECGACTVLVDGLAVDSCLYPALKAHHREVTTIEGLASGDELHPLQQAFIEAGAVQCGFCTPGMIMAAKALLDENPSPDESEIKLAVSGNLCRCTGYTKIVAAVQAAAGKGGK